MQMNTIKKYEQLATEEGEARGEARGEAKNRLNVAKKLIKLGVAIEIIIEATGLTRKKIEKIKEKI